MASAIVPARVERGLALGLGPFGVAGARRPLRERVDEATIASGHCRDQAGCHLQRLPRRISRGLGRCSCLSSLTSLCRAAPAVRLIGPTGGLPVGKCSRRLDKALLELPFGMMGTPAPRGGHLCCALRRLPHSCGCRVWLFAATTIRENVAGIQLCTPVYSLKFHD